MCHNWVSHFLTVVNGLDQSIIGGDRLEANGAFGTLHQKVEVSIKGKIQNLMHFASSGWMTDKLSSSCYTGTVQGVMRV